MSISSYKITIIHSDRKTLSIKLLPNEIVIRAPFQMRDKEIYSFVESRKKWIETNMELILKREAEKEKLPPLSKEELQNLSLKAKEVIAKKVEFYASKIGVTYNKITIRSQRSRWGSCSSKGNLNFNCILMLFPDEIIDSVVVHELCHRKYMNHSKQFYLLVESVFPSYQKCKKWLDENGSKYLSRIEK